MMPPRSIFLILASTVPTDTPTFLAICLLENRASSRSPCRILTSVSFSSILFCSLYVFAVKATFLGHTSNKQPFMFI
jgi:hypothetical protein